MSAWSWEGDTEQQHYWPEHLTLRISFHTSSALTHDLEFFAWTLGVYKHAANKRNGS